MCRVRIKWNGQWNMKWKLARKSGNKMTRNLFWDAKFLTEVGMLQQCGVSIETEMETETLQMYGPKPYLNPAVSRRDH